MKSLTAQLYPRLKIWILIWCVCFVLLLLSQTIEQTLNQSMMQAMQKESTSFLWIAAGLFVNGMGFMWLQSVVSMALISSSTIKSTFNLSLNSTLNSEFNNAHSTLAVQINDFSKEWIRSIGNASLWMFLLVLPGLLRWVDYLLLPFVCFFDSSYQQGQCDALQQCRHQARPIRRQLWCLWIGLGVLVPLALTSFFGDSKSLIEEPLKASALVGLDALTQSFGFFILFHLYQKSLPLKETLAPPPTSNNQPTMS